MAVHLATSSDYLKRTTALLPASGDSTVVLWVNFVAVSTAPAYQTPYIILDDPGVYTDYAGFFGNSAALSLDVSTNATTTTTPTANTWYHLAWVQSGTSQRFYVNGTLIGSKTVNRAAVTDGFELIGNDTFSDGNISAAYCREWTAALPIALIKKEMWASTARTTSNLYMDCPLTSDLLDISGNSHDWSQVGSGSFVAGPEVFTNTSAATAVALSSALPFSQTVDIPENFWNAVSGGNIFLYYTYTPPVGAGIMTGLWFSAPLAADYSPEFNASTPSVAQVLDAVNVPMQIPTVAGETWTISVTNRGTTTTGPETLTISGVVAPTTAIPTGSIFTNDDTVGWGTAVISATDGADYQVLQFVDLPSTTSENGGDVLENGRFLIAADETLEYQLYNADLTLNTVVSGLVSQIATTVRTCVGTQVFYIGKNGNSVGPVVATLHRVDGDGLLTDSWSLPTYGLFACAASNDEATVYVVGQGHGAVITPNGPIKQWDTATSTFGADLVAGTVAYYIADLLVLGDDSILALYHHFNAHEQYIKRYDAAGATLNTYTLPDTVGPSLSPDLSLFHAIDDPTSFWTRVHDLTGVGAGTCTFFNIHVADGAILATINQATYEQGTYAGDQTDTPFARFGLSASCPSFILREGVIPPIPIVEPVTTLIRRERIFRHLSDEQQWIFYQWMQLDIEAGVGLSEGQGSDPQVILQWSDDGGHTWSNEHFLSAGKQGEYGRRAMLKQPLGRSRDRVFKVAMSDPVKWALLNAYFGAEKGPS